MHFAALERELKFPLFDSSEYAGGFSVYSFKLSLMARNLCLDGSPFHICSRPAVSGLMV